MNSSTSDKAITDCLHTLRVEIEDWREFGDLDRNRSQAAVAAVVLVQDVLRSDSDEQIEARIERVRMFYKGRSR